MKNKRILQLFQLVALISILSSYSQRLHAQFGFSLPEGEKSIDIPFQNFNNLIVLEVTLKNKVAVNLILDTSIEHTILTEKAIGDFLNFRYARKMKLGQNGDQVYYGHVAVDAKMSLSDSVSTGDVSSMLVLETDYLNLAGLAGSKVHGLIGYDIFKSFVVEVDHTKNVLTLYKPESFSPPKSHLELPMDIIDRKPYISTEIVFESWESRKMKFILKSGASHAVFFEDDSIEYFLPYRNLEVPIGQSFGGELLGHIGRLRSLNIDEFALQDPLATFSKPEHIDQSGSTKKAGDGSMGQGILSRFSVIYDFHRAKIYLRKNNSFDNLFEYDMSGISIAVSHSQDYSFSIKSLRKESPAQKSGLQVGDIIESINGDPLTIDNYGEFLNLFLTREGKKVTFVVKRGSEITECSYRLTRFI
ncbi:PDZ domain (Also known as DHR or GLGF) [Reichenbachiella faecimaris]|uniref:PDZ domain (Also known as DHR or GLGF) n=1 Tax=Reichenbachiella faecimaris TaxID=692418 RepID=A0A1W2GEN6_REIFA|nr:PDZ domain-containing protein [Reichenbachiella faecimaris]SMD34716.1 PDZ domain (Also known as DHR or GLGF) [Reichenbachiella faecimaris]